MAAGCTVVIFYLCTKAIGHRALPWYLPSFTDKIVHATMFGTLFGLGYAYIKPMGVAKIDIYIWLTICALYSAGIELLQKYIYTHRSADVWDLVANITGIILVYLFLEYRHNKKSKNEFKETYETN